MKNKHLTQLFTFILLILTFSCSKEDSNNSDIINVFDCQLDDDINFIGVCLNGPTSSNPNEKNTYTSKASANFSEIRWEIESGSMQILNIENSFDNNLPKSVANIQFNSDFTGGSIKVISIQNGSDNSAEISNYRIDLN